MDFNAAGRLSATEKASCVELRCGIITLAFGRRLGFLKPTPDSGPPTLKMNFPTLARPAHAIAPIFPRGQSFARILRSWLWLALLAAAAPFASRAETEGDGEATWLGKARKHIADNTPKGLTPLKPADVKFITNVIKVRVVEFTLELECDEPRYTVRDLLSAGKVLPADVTKQLQAAGLSARYLGQKYSKGEALPPIRDTFSIRADGSFGAVRALTPEKLGVLRSELPELPVEGEEKHLAAQGAADLQVQAQAKAKSESKKATFGSIFVGIKDAANVAGGFLNKSPETKKKLDAVTNALEAATGQPDAAAPPAPVTPAAGAPTQPAPPVVSLPEASKDGKASKDTAGVPAKSLKPEPPEKPEKAVAEWLTPVEAAALLKISESDVLNAINKGEIKAKKIGPVWRIPAKELQ